MINKIEITLEQVREALKDTEWKWIAKDQCGDVFTYKQKPKREYSTWGDGYEYELISGSLITFKELKYTSWEESLTELYPVEVKVGQLCLFTNILGNEYLDVFTSADINSSQKIKPLSKEEVKVFLDKAE